MREVIGCESLGVELECDGTGDVIKILSATFGRTENASER